MIYTNITLGELLSSDNPAIKRNATGILRQLMKEEKTPSKEEIKEYMELHNNDEIGINNKWDMKEAEYYLLLDDKYYYRNRLNR